MVEPWLNAGTNVNAINDSGITPLMTAAKKGNQEVMKMLLKQPNIDPQQQVNDPLLMLHNSKIYT